MRFGLVVWDFCVFPIKGGVLDDVEVSNVDCVVEWVRGVVVKEVLIEWEGLGVSLGGAINAVDYEWFLV